MPTYYILQYTNIIIYNLFIEYTLHYKNMVISIIAYEYTILCKYVHKLLYTNILK